VCCSLLPLPLLLLTTCSFAGHLELMYPLLQLQQPTLTY
jgi:hypothetical protein